MMCSTSNFINVLLYTFPCCLSFYFHMPVLLSLKYYLLGNEEYLYFLQVSKSVFPFSFRVKATILITDQSMCPSLPHFPFLCPHPYTHSVLLAVSGAHQADRGCSLHTECSSPNNSMPHSFTPSNMCSVSPFL